MGGCGVRGRRRWLQHRDETLSTPVEKKKKDASLGLHVKGSLCSTWDAFPVAKLERLYLSAPVSCSAPLWLHWKIFFFLLFSHSSSSSSSEREKKRNHETNSFPHPLPYASIPPLVVGASSSLPFPAFVFFYFLSLLPSTRTTTRISRGEREKPPLWYVGSGVEMGLLILIEWRHVIESSGLLI